MIFRIGLVMAALFVSPMAAATLLDHGPSGQFFRDTASGLYWYDPAEFVGQSRTQVNSFQADNPLWRWATSAEIDGLMGQRSPAGVPLESVMGARQFDLSNSGPRWIGFYADVEPDGWLVQSDLDPAFEVVTDTSFQNDVVNFGADVGAWLVSTTDPVESPEPPLQLWTGSGTALSGPTMTTTVIADGSEGPPILAYDNNAPNTGGSGASGEWRFSTIAAASGTVDLNYDYRGFHAFFQVTVNLEAFVFDGDTTTTIPLVADGPAICCTPPSTGFRYNGDVSLTVGEGDEYGFRMSGRNFDSNSRLRGTLQVNSIETFGDAVLVQAVPAGGHTLVFAHVTGAPGNTQTVELLTADVCVAGELDEDAVAFGEFSATFDANGEAFLAELVSNTVPIATYAAARLAGSQSAGETSACIVAGPDNDSWVRALPVPLLPMGDAAVADVSGFLDSAGKSRWYRFFIQPGARARIDLSGLAADYDLAVFKDIAKAYLVGLGEDDVDGLNRLSAEFAPSVFSPSVFSPSVFSPSVFSPDAYAPSVFSPSVFSPSVFSPSVFSPSVFSPSVFSPSVFSPSVFSPSVFSPSVFSPSVFSPSVFSPSVFSSENFASAQVRSLIAVAAQTGNGSERALVDTWNNTGEFYVRVSGKNGAFDVENPFQLSISLEGALCVGVEPLSGPVSASGGGYKSIILWDSAQTDPTAPGNTAEVMQAMLAKLNALALRDEVAGVVVDLAEFAHIQELHAQAEGASSCPYAENLTARAIKEVVAAYRDMNPEMAYVVIVGSDAQVPFFRYPDQALLGPEQDYDPPVANGTQSQSALRLNYVLGQDEYGSATSLSLRDGEFPIPDLAVGRLVESAAEINTLLDAYLATAAGVIDTPGSTLVTGYDFLQDAADAVQFELVAGTVGARNDTLITAADISPADPRSWTAEDLRRELLDEAEDIVFLAGHFSANSTLAADYQTTALATELADADIDLTNTLVFSAGCHSGYNIVDGDAIPGVTEPLDWTQAFAQKGATLIAGTGYQYGDTDFIEYSEKLYVLFARQLRAGSGPVAFGDALVRAKQEYLAGASEIRGLHRKSMLISTLFGLPMLSVDMPGERIVPDDGLSDIEIEGVTGGPGARLELQRATVAFDFSGALTEQLVELTNLDGGVLTASYLEGPDPQNQVVTNPAEPTLPLVAKNVSVPGVSLRGIGFRGGAWSESPVLPLTGAPTTELRGVHTPFTSLVNFPMRLAVPNYYGAISGSGGTILNVTPAQHRVADVGDFEATRREFASLDFDLFYSNNTQMFGGNTPALAGPPTMTSVRAVIDGPDVVFLVNVMGDPAAGIQAVWVTYTEGAASSGQWVSLDLLQSTIDSTLWSGRLAGAASSFNRLDYVIQAVNGTGLVALDDNYGAYYQVAGQIGEVGPDGTPADLMTSELTLFGPDMGVFGGSVDLQAMLTADGTPVPEAAIVFSLGGSGRAARTDSSGSAQVLLPLNATPGEYTLTASFAGDGLFSAASAEQPFAVTKASTAISLASGPQAVGVHGIDSGISAELRDLHGTPLLQRTVYFTVSGGPDGAITVPRITNNVGTAELGSLALPARNYEITARFLGEIPADGGVLTIDDPVYEPSLATIDIKLKRAASCPARKFTPQPPAKSTRGSKAAALAKPDRGSKAATRQPAGRQAGRKLELSGFCYLTHPVDASIQISEGTLILGSGVRVSKGIKQAGQGGVQVNESARVGGNVMEQDAGGVFVAGSVDGALREAGGGGVEVLAAGVIKGDVTEQDNGAIVVNGVVGGKVKERGAGNLTIGPNGRVRGSAFEMDAGSLFNDGRVGGTTRQD